MPEFKFKCAVVKIDCGKASREGDDEKSGTPTRAIYVSKEEKDTFDEAFVYIE